MAPKLGSYNYLDSDKLIVGKQSAYRQSYSVLLCLLTCTNDWYLNLMSGKYTATTFVDLNKPFDTVNHDISQQEHQLSGLHDKELKWFCSNLISRKQCCKVNGKLSHVEYLGCGASQGSCPGPLLFIICIYDLYVQNTPT